MFSHNDIDSLSVLAAATYWATESALVPETIEAERTASELPPDEGSEIEWPT